MTNNKKMIISVEILVAVIIVGSVIFGIFKFHQHQVDQRIQEEQFHRESERKIVRQVVREYEGIESVTFTFVSPEAFGGGYTYSFYVNDEKPNKNGDTLWSTDIDYDKTIGTESFPRKGSYADKSDKDLTWVTESKYFRSKPLKKVDISNVKIHYRVKADK
ncbi:hypothetical protein [Companilactobacillus mishanensis]|uniref:DUF5590 domain-containing protein n=1 Tax=Companilactobacillus mishanensis TaxID=2486008 RepID=A0ABW9P8A6_9LACO|nr:hypothetical protein [Companilactobacillus mishanensis]MQS45514.1 hypothetical protein [Companilactobacillus mishanensis]